MCPQRIDRMDGFLGKVESLRDPTNTSLGQIFCIGTERIREKFGDARWRRSEELVAKLIEKSIEQHCDSKDVFLRCRDASYLILFSDPSMAKAEAASTKIAEFVNDSLFGSEEGEALTIQSVVRTAAGLQETNAFTTAEVIGRLREQAETVEIGKHDTSKASNGPTLVASDDDGAGTAPDNPVPAKKDKELKLPSNRQELFAKLRSVQDAPIKFQYLPLWDVSRRRVRTFNCVPCRNSAISGEPLWNYAVLGKDPDIADIIALDIAALEKGLLDLTENLLGGMSCNLVPNLHFETLANKKGKQEVSALLAELPDLIRQCVWPSVVQIPDGVPEGRLMEISGHIGSYCGNVGAVLVPEKLKNDLNKTLIRYRAGGFTGIFLRFKDAPTKAEIKELLSIADRSREIGGHVGVTGISDAETLIQLAYSNIGFISGSVFGGPYDEIPLEYDFDAKNLEGLKAAC